MPLSILLVGVAILLLLLLLLLRLLHVSGLQRQAKWGQNTKRNSRNTTDCQPGVTV
jgi:hypothetical protein